MNDPMPHFLAYAIGLNEEVRDYIESLKPADDERNELIQDLHHEIESFSSRPEYDPDDPLMQDVYKTMVDNLSRLTHR